MGIISSVTDHTLGAGWRAVRDTARGAVSGDLKDIAKVAVVASMATGSLPLATGMVALAGNAAVGSLVDVFA